VEDWEVLVVEEKIKIFEALDVMMEEESAGADQDLGLGTAKRDLVAVTVKDDLAAVTVSVAGHVTESAARGQDPGHVNAGGKKGRTDRMEKMELMSRMNQLIRDMMLRSVKLATLLTTAMFKLSKRRSNSFIHLQLSVNFVV